MAQTYKIRLKRWNGSDFDTLKLPSSDILMDSGATVEDAINGKAAINDSATTVNNVWSAQKTQDEINNSKPRIASVSLSTTWNGSSPGPYTQNITISGQTITNKTKVDIQPNSTILTAMSNDGIYGMYIENNNGTLTAYSVGEKPTTSLTIQVSLVEVK